MYKPHTICRACEHTELVPVFDLGVQPLANDFSFPGAESPGYAPLKVLFCPNCTLAQLSVVVQPELLYSHYSYVTSRSDTMQQHFQSLWNAINEECRPERVIEIGSNDGLFLQFCKSHGADSVLGIDPAENLKPSDGSIISVCGLFDCVSAGIAHTAMPEPSVIVARHVFAHIDDWRGFITNLDTLATKETLIVIEVPDVLDLLAKVELDTIYHEHLSYVSVQAVEALLKHSQFHLHEVRHFPVHGGAMVLMLRRNDSSRYPKEISYTRITPQMWEDFRNYGRSSIGFLRNEVNYHSMKGHTICGFGASAKSTVWIAACGFTGEQIQFICDCTPQKQGAYSPGTLIPIVPESRLLERMPNYCIIFAWNYYEEIVSKNRQYLELGGKFILPGKTVKVISRKGISGPSL